jgi:putative secretion ATPase (PEP-CTERM system associated)
MYTDFYGLAGFPFQLTPDCRFFFDSRPHRKAMAYLTYGLSKGEGFIVITGEIGAGKTTMIDYLMSSLEGKSIVTARVVTTQVQANDLLRMVGTAFGVTGGRSNKATLLGQIEDFLIANHRAHRRAFLVVDEVQSLASSSLEELRMLSNFSVGQRPLLQICLVGQPEFRRTLASERLEQLRQRIIASHHLVPLDTEETRGYIEHRLRRVGWTDDPRFTDDAFARIHEETRGIPRRINTLCDRLLLFGYLEEKRELGGGDVAEVIVDMREEVAPASVGAVVGHAPSPQPAGRRPAGTAATADDVARLHDRIADIERLLVAALTKSDRSDGPSPDVRRDREASSTQDAAAWAETATFADEEPEH